MTGDAYFDAADGRWRNADDELLDERREDDPDADPTEEEVEAPKVADDWRTNPRLTGDPEFARAMRAEPNYGRMRTTNPTGLKGRGVRGPRAGKTASVEFSDGRVIQFPVEGDPMKQTVRPTGRQLGGRAPVVGRPALDDAGVTVEKMLGPKRIKLLRASLKSKGRPTAPAQRARVYLAVILQILDDPKANRGAAELLLGEANESTLRKIGDLRRRTYSEIELDVAWGELRRRAAQK